MIDFASIYKLVKTRIMMKLILAGLVKPAILFNFMLNILLGSLSVLSVSSGAGIIVENKWLGKNFQCFLVTLN